MIENLSIIIDSFNTTVNGLEIAYHCKEGFAPKDVATSICTLEEGIWSPDPIEHECIIEQFENEIFHTVTQSTFSNLTTLKSKLTDWIAHHAYMHALAVFSCMSVEFHHTESAEHLINNLVPKQLESLHS